MKGVSEMDHLRVEELPYWFIAILLGAALLAACVPPGARNWPFSIGPQTYAVALGDLDGDGDLDAFLANGENEVPEPNTVWLNDGAGNFHNSGQQVGSWESRHVILADMDGDGMLDAVVANTGPISIYLNRGQGVFTTATVNLGQQDPGSYILAPAIGDVNGDGWLDVFGGGCCGATEIWDDGRREVHPSHDSLWLNNGQGGFTDSGQKFDIMGTKAIALGDLDGNGHLDAFFANHSSHLGNGENLDSFQANTVWFNDGQGFFRVSEQVLGEAMSQAVVLGDLDGDGDLDAFVGNEHEDEVWLNQGGRQGGEEGSFILAASIGDRSATRALFLADFDGDGDLDVLVVGGRSGQVWFNDGLAEFTRGPRFDFEAHHALAVGDLDGDGSPDIFAGSVNHGILVWLNDGQGSFSQRDTDS
jgi:hypothetical protein